MQIVVNSKLLLAVFIEIQNINTDRIIWLFQSMPTRIAALFFSEHVIRVELKLIDISHKEFLK